MKMMQMILHLFDHFEIEYFTSGDLLVSSCPVHNGDNPSAFNININSNSPHYGTWFCNTKKCHETHRRDVIGLIQGILDKKKKHSYNDVIKFCQNFNEKTPITKKVKIKTVTVDTNKYPRNLVRKNLIMPAKTYLDKGFSEQILDEFDIGVCLNPKAEMYNRVVFPVYDNADKYMIGCVGRTLNDNYTKWRNKKGFNKSAHLYGLNKAIDYIKKTSTVILVEGQGDVLRMHQAGIRNCVGLFGSKMSGLQEFALQTLKLKNIIVATDNDEAGLACREDIEEKLKDIYNVTHFISTKNDFQDMEVEEIKKNFKDKVEKLA